MLSGSMAGALLPGDILTVRPPGRQKAHAGDIVVFRGNGKLIAHRLIFVLRLRSLALLVEKGDAMAEASILRASDIVGIVSAARRRGSVVLAMTPEARTRARSLASRAFLWHLAYEAPKNFLKRIAGRDARV
jgi:SOS-response transcriptional repressor LexA